MAFLNSPILKARRLGALSPETERKFKLARERPHKPDLTDFKRLHESIAKTQKSFALLDMNANVNALKRINEETKKHVDKLGNLKEGFNKVKVNEKIGFEFDERVVNDVRDRIMCSMIDPQGGMSSVSVSRSRKSSDGMSVSKCSDLDRDMSVTSTTLLPDLTEDSSTLKPRSFQNTDDLFDTDTESILSDFEMEIVNVSPSSDYHLRSDGSSEFGEHLDINLTNDTLNGRTVLSQKSVILSASGMYCIDPEEGEYTMISEIRTSPYEADDCYHPQLEVSSSSDSEGSISEMYVDSPVITVKKAVVDTKNESLKVFVGETRKNPCKTCSSWDACTWLCSQQELETTVKDPLEMIITEEDSKVHIAVFNSPVLTRKAPTVERAEELEVSGRNLSDKKVGDLPYFDRPEDLSDKEAFHSYLESLNKYDNLDSVSISESLETKSLESCDFERLELMLSAEDTDAEKKPAVKSRGRSVMKKLRFKNDKVKSFVKQASNVLHSASADFTRFGPKRSASSANLKAVRSSSTSSFYKRSYIPTPSYNLTSTLFPDETETLNLDTRLKLRNRELIEVEPLPRWNRKPIFATTTTGHKAWYERAQDMIERRRREMVNMDVLESDIGQQDVDIIVSIFQSYTVHQFSPFQLNVSLLKFALCTRVQRIMKAPRRFPCYKRIWSSYFKSLCTA